ncbi:hypothetical protein FVE85_6810 [Porphyridium purpureum]|uniref:Uncharacterized protein n=1 Tax=Porphyridium purpureum TaxID=35688 RepID=A0A5J4Z7A8_PORPP|nr:hypothetical protein FVE85_6810 [Porphyridium purpureum]|eukprot:POR3872..scf295_1
MTHCSTRPGTARCWSVSATRAAFLVCAFAPTSWLEYQAANYDNTRLRLALCHTSCRAREHLRKLVDDVKKQLARSRAREYDLTMSPTFQESKTARGRNPKVLCKTAQEMISRRLRLSQTLLASMAHYHGSSWILVSEAFTSTIYG